MNKKSAVEATTLVLYIILIATTLALAGAVTTYSKLASKDAKKKACEWDIMKAYYSKKVPAAKNLFTRGHRQTALTNCQRDKLGQLIIRYDDIVERGVINQKKASRIIVDEMIDYWKMVGAGKIDPFSNWEEVDKSYCFVSPTIKLEDRLMNFIKKGNEELTKLVKNESRQATEDELSKYNILAFNEYIATERVSKDGPTIEEFFYKTKSSSLTQNIIKSEMQKEDAQGTMLFSPDSAILIRMYKFEKKSKVKFFLGLVGGGILVIGGAVVLLFTWWTGVGAGLGAFLIKLGIGVGVAAVGVFILIPTAQYAFDDCIPECNAVGGIGILPPEVPFNTEIPVYIDDNKKQKPICDLIVN